VASGRLAFVADPVARVDLRANRFSLRASDRFLAGRGVDRREGDFNSDSKGAIIVSWLIGAPIIVAAIVGWWSLCLLPFAAVAWLLTHLFR
jgi:hypothetical protein